MGRLLLGFILCLNVTSVFGAHARVAYSTKQIIAKLAKALPKNLPEELQDTLNQYRFTSANPIYPNPFVKNPKLADQLGLDRFYRFNFEGDSIDQNLINKLSEFKDVFESVEFDYVGEIAGQFIPNDEYFSDQYALHNTGQGTYNLPPGVSDSDMDLPEAWFQLTRQNDLTVAVIDSGVQDAHPDFTGRVLSGMNTMTWASDPQSTRDDDCPHGTHVAGIIAAQGNNQIGIAGIAWRAKILPVRVLSGCYGWESDAASGAIWAADHGASIENFSLQYGGGSTFFLSAIQYAHDSGVTVVSASGNWGTSYLAYPAAFAQSISVGAIDNANNRAAFSNYGAGLSLVAPGVGIISTYGSSSYQELSGTSMAAPQVAGVAALLKLQNASLTPDQIQNILERTTDSLTGTHGPSPEYGMGRVNASNALRHLNCPIDLNFDLVVNEADIPLFQAAFSSGDLFLADLNADNRIDNLDKKTFSILYSTRCQIFSATARPR